MVAHKNITHVRKELNSAGLILQVTSAETGANSNRGSDQRSPMRALLDAYVTQKCLQETLNTGGNHSLLKHVGKQLTRSKTEKETLPGMIAPDPPPKNTRTSSISPVSQEAPVRSGKRPQSDMPDPDVYVISPNLDELQTM
ncbi:hypothetical protein BaRGS_00006862 [Batillaria attramentaria]|uniref:Uncharacterized protein n=1 Tax=Batillaria attramentaria TaxID=370345 RepID=A0ABD0LQN2_9CAEN